MTDSAKRIMQGLKEALADAQGENVPALDTHPIGGYTTEELRIAAQEGLRSSPSHHAGMDDIKTKARRRLESTRSD